MSSGLAVLAALILCLAGRAQKRYRMFAVFFMLLVITLSGSYQLLINDKYVFTGLSGGLLFGQLAFFFSLLLTTQSFIESGHLIKLPMFALVEMLKSFFLRYVWISALEELVWRGAIQEMLGQGPIAIAFVAAAFTLSHKPKQGFQLATFLDLSMFALLLGALFSLTHSIFLVIMVHAVRNINLTVLKLKLLQQFAPADGRA